MTDSELHARRARERGSTAARAYAARWQRDEARNGMGEAALADAGLSHC